ncbi:MAG TPA: glucose-6-phosphate isomerase, partial [Bacillota bacterium]|nr:glucose-6-phosphate isomerase [Bacillota bacterium]
VNQGLAVMGNKGSSDQHSYVQQLVAGPSNIFVTFVQVLKDREGASPDVGGGSTSGDYLSAFMLGTRRALTGHGKAVMSISVPLADAQCIGRIIALFERSVGFYASMINVNAYDQPAVEYGKKAADSLIALKDRLLGALGPSPRSAKSLADELSADFADCFRLLLHLAYTKVNVGMKAAPRAEDSLFFLKDKK